jgi:CHAT domain-containing protein/tetratricopeptide (TPR) repeat protein
MRWLISLVFLLTASPPASAQKPATQSLKDAIALYQAGDIPGSRRALEQTIDLAVQQQDRQVEAEARFIVGTARSQIAQYEPSNVQFRAALPLFEQLGNRSRQAEIYSGLGANALGTGNFPEARSNFEKAMALYEALGDWAGVASEHYQLAFVSSGAEWLEHMQRGLEVARKTGARRTEAELLHLWADREYSSDDFDVAFDRLNQARSILEDLGDPEALAGVLTSIGRLYRVHGHPDEAFHYYQRARDLEKETGNVRGMIQSLNAMGVALNILGRSSEALRYDQEALQLARQSGSSFLIKAILEAVASSQIHLGQIEQAAAVLEEARQMPPPRVSTLDLLSQARFMLGQYEAAWKTADEALAIGDAGAEITRDVLENRASALWKLGRTSEALRDVRQSMESVEQARAKLVPTDFMRQGFSDTDRSATGVAIHILLDSGQEREALEAAERARGRAFLDLLATKDLAHSGTAGGGLHDPVTDSATGSVAPRSLAPLQDVPASTAEAVPSRRRGSPTPVSVQDALALARRLDSTILAYWVDDSSTIIWIVSPDGRVAHARTGFGAHTLDKWIDEALGPADQSAPSKIQVASRGGETLLAGSGSRATWRRLYDALIRPVRSNLPSNLPSQPVSRLTIIPSGPLFRLSFAALVDEKGRYLIENYALHYSPAIEVFQYTRQAQERASALPARYLLVANPSAMPLAYGKTLPALPGSEKEAQSIARLAPPGSAVLLQGKQAGEAAVREAMPAAKVIHLATHGVVNNSNPLDSFLALGRTSDQPGANGRLTAAEVYSLDLHADLVVLSACRTGLGRISGDGVAGLARAFVYAGAASVVSTLWDVPDQPTAQLLEDFYRAFAKGGKNVKSEALRASQLRLLRSLRRGEVRVDTPFGRLSLPEDPVLWAGYVLIGEP